MKQPDAKLFQAFELDVAELEHDVSQIVRGISRGVEAYCEVRWGEEAPYSQIRLPNLTEEKRRLMVDELTECAERITCELAQTLCKSDILAVSVQSGRLIYATLDPVDSMLDFHELREGQCLRGIYRTLAVQGYMPETFVAAEADGEELAREMHPFGLNLLLDNVVVDGLAEDDYAPVPGEAIWLPVHYSQLRVKTLGDRGA